MRGKEEYFMAGSQGRGRGFAGMDDEKQREIAAKGGRAAHLKGTAHEFTPEEAREAGRKGGQVVSQNREHMAAIGREGGQARGHKLSSAAKREQATASSSVQSGQRMPPAEIARKATEHEEGMQDTMDGARATETSTYPGGAPSREGGRSPGHEAASRSNPSTQLSGAGETLNTGLREAGRRTLESRSAPRGSE
jgi:general stress protein YciG